MADGAKTGVYLCQGCGLGEAFDMDGLEAAAAERGPAVCKRHDMLCGEEGVKLIAADVAAGTVNRPVIAACSQRVMADRFRFPGAHVVRANLREQVAWCHAPGDEDTQMLAADTVRMGLAQAEKSSPPRETPESGASQRILVVGGGHTGLNAAREASRAGHKVLLVESADRLGGWAARFSRRLPHRAPYRDPQPNAIDDLIAEIGGDSRITVKTGMTVTRTEGAPGRFAVTLSDGAAETVGAIVVATGWREYDAAKLGHLGYGASPDVVTNIQLEAMLAKGEVVRPSDGKPPRTIAFVQCAGSRDADHLPYCSSICCAVSLKHALQLKETDPDIDAYVLYEEMRTPGTAEEFYRQAQEAGVIFVKGKVKGVGADLTVTIDDALLGQEVPMAGLDMVVLATGMVPNSTVPGAEAADKGDEQITDDVDLTAPIAVAGYAGNAPDTPAARETGPLPGGPILNLQYRQGPHLPVLADGFVDSHFICFPYETRRSGIYTCGPLRRPMDMAECERDAQGAVLKAIQSVRRAGQGAGLHPRAGDLSFPRINLDICTKCRRCTVECPFGAIDENENDYPLVNPSRCRRCGTCMGACPVRTISFDNYSVEMVSEMIASVDIPDEFSGKPRILAFACENDAYPALDMAGLQRLTYSAYIRIIPVRCLGSVSAVWVSDALSRGFDGVMMMGCKPGDDYQCHFVKGSAIAGERAEVFAETLQSLMLEEERINNVEVSIADAARLPAIIDEFSRRIEEIGLSPFKGF